jgi:hypothetical protein
MDFKQKTKDLLELLKTQRKYQLGAGILVLMIMFLMLSDNKPNRRPPLSAHKAPEKNITETLGRKEAYDDLIEAFKTDMESVKSDIGSLRSSSEENSKRIEEYQARTAEIFKKIIERQADTESKFIASGSGNGSNTDTAGPVDVSMNKDTAASINSDDGLAEFGDKAEPLPPPPPAPGKIAYIGAGDSVQVKLLAGVRAPTEGNPYPVIFKLISDVHGPDGSALPLGEARVIAAAQGSLTDQRALFRLTSLNIRYPNGKRKVIDVDGWVVGEDGILGMEGILIDPIGKSIGAAALIGGVNGLGQGLSQSQVTVQEPGVNNYLGSASTATSVTGNLGAYAFGKGVSKATDEWSKIVSDRAAKLTPLVEVFSGREATAVFAKSVSIPELFDAIGDEDNTLTSID